VEISEEVNMKNRKGITLVELIVVIVLVSMVLVIAGTFMNFSFMTQKTSANEYKVQADLRLASTIINNEIRNSTVTFTLPITKFMPASARDQNWNYIGIEDNKRVVQITPNGTSTPAVQVLFTAGEGISYSLKFAKQSIPDYNSKLIQYTIEATVDSNNSKKISILSKVEAINSIAVDEGGSLNNPAVAIAYKKTPIPASQTKPLVAIALVLDNSGSMDWKMGGTGLDKDKIRKELVIKNAKDLVNKFDAPEMTNINIAVIPFSNKADNKEAKAGWKTPSIAAQKTLITDMIESITGDSGTNTGDGMRRAYARLVEFKNANPGKTINYYMILITDGNPTYVSSYDDNSYDPQLGSADVIHYIQKSWVDNDDPLNYEYCMQYVYKIGTVMIKSGAPNIKSFVIGVSGVQADLNRSASIAAIACTASPANPSIVGEYYYAGSEAQLSAAFDSIYTVVQTDIWHILGPY
jgi:type II secretory pathway pseudopilin PulG